MVKKGKSTANIKEGAELIFSELEIKKTLTIEQKYQYLEQLRDYIYKDVVLADNKAGFALTMVTVTIAAAFALFKEANIFWIIGLIFSGFSIFCSMLTLLPRSYVTHIMVKNPKHWVNLKEGRLNELNRRYRDAFNVIFENLWQKQSMGTTDSLKSLLNSGTETEIVNSLYVAMQRAFLAQTLKYLWIGKALLFAFLAFCSIAISFFISVDKLKNKSDESSKLNPKVVDSIFHEENKLQKNDAFIYNENIEASKKAKPDSIKKNKNTLNK